MPTSRGICTGGEADQLPKSSAVDQDGNSKLSLEEAKAVGINEVAFELARLAEGPLS